MLYNFFNPAPNSKNNWMAADPLSIITLVATVAVPDLREVVALRWMDFVPNATLGTYHFQLTHYLSADGIMRPLFDRARERYRCVPLAPAFAQILLEYKQYLISTYHISEVDLALCPIIMENHAALRKSILRLKPCDLKAATAKIKEYTTEAKIASNEVHLPDPIHGIDSDLNNYQGNILYTNLKYTLRHICKFTEGELCYFLGRKAPDTFSAHYCAYNHPVLQHRMACKLNRWLCTLIKDKQNNPPSYKACTLEGSQSLVLANDDYGLVHADINFIPQNSASSNNIMLEIQSKHGTVGTIVTIANEEASLDE